MNELEAYSPPFLDSLHDFGLLKVYRKVNGKQNISLLKHCTKIIEHDTNNGKVMDSMAMH